MLSVDHEEMRIEPHPYFYRRANQAHKYILVMKYITYIKMLMYVHNA